MSTQQPTATSLILLNRIADGWEATQDDVEVVGEGADPGEAVADYGKQVSETFYQNQGQNQDQQRARAADD